MKDLDHCFIFIRTDIPLAQQMVQSAHAALELGLRQDMTSHSSRTIVLCQTSDEPALLALAEQCFELDLPVHLFHEPDAHLGYPPGYTALAVLGNKKTKKVFSKQKLWQPVVFEQHQSFNKIDKL